MGSAESTPTDSTPEKTTILRHYTSEQAAEQIQQSGVILQSGTGGNDDAAFGKGTYFTSIPPTEPATAIAENNYDDGGQFVEQQIDAGKLDRVITVEFDENDPALVKCDTDRDVYLYNGDVELEDHNYTITKLN